MDLAGGKPEGCPESASTIGQLDGIDICRPLYLITVEYTFLSSLHGDIHQR